MPDMELRWEKVFAPDSGTLLDIRVYGTTADDHVRVLNMLAKRYRVLYSEDGTVRDLPDYATIVHRKKSHSVSVDVDVLGVDVRCLFWDEAELVLDLLPGRVDSAEKAEAVFALMKTIADTLNKQVLLTAENASATSQWSEEHAICKFAPSRLDPNC
jgi:hypothetical protein